MDIRIFMRLHELIQLEQTGKPKEFAKKFGFSERSLHYYSSFMKNAMNAPIVYENSSASCTHTIASCVLKNSK